MKLFVLFPHQIGKLVNSTSQQAKPKKGQGLMDKKEKRKLSESDICDLFISPAIKDAGWDPMQQIRREVTLTPGPVIVRGNMSSRNKKKGSSGKFVGKNITDSL